MPFNSYSFVFIFLPLTLLGYHVLARGPLHRFRQAFLILATLIFYARGAVVFLPLLLISIFANWALGLAIAGAAGGWRKLLLTLAVVLDLAALIYFKYANFLAGIGAGLVGLHYTPVHIPLPLAISFYTFQQIAYVIEVSRGATKPARLVDYFGFILFFPSIVSGPIVFYRELAPQLELRPERAKLVEDLTVGSVIFSLGLFKKTVIADTFALWVDPAFAAAHAGAPIGAAAAWGAAAAYVLQLYFDFSGYSDMAIGLGRMFGVVLPMNFFSPIRCTSILEYWRRWHMTLSRWVNLYIFQTLAIPAARLSSRWNLGGYGDLAVSTLAPTLVTMLIIGAWHGGNWTYVVFGAMHGVYMMTAEVWNRIWRKARRGKPEPFLRKARGNIVTMAAVVVAIVPFRSIDMTAAIRMWSAMVGTHGWTGAWNDWGALPSLGAAGMLLVIVPGLLMAYLLPNTEQFTTLFTPALEWTRWRGVSPPAVKLTWRPTWWWSLAVGVVLFLGLAYIARGGASFVYFNF